MIRIVIVTHGMLAKELVETARLIFGHLDGVSAINLPRDRDVNEMKAELASAVSEAGQDPVILLTDMYGGSAFMASAVHASGPGRMLVAGVNLPLLMDILLARDGGDLAAVRSSVEANRERYLVVYQEPAK